MRIDAVLQDSHRQELFQVDSHGQGGYQIRLHPRAVAQFVNAPQDSYSAGVDALTTLADQLRSDGLIVERRPVLNGSYLWVKDAA